MFALSEPYTSKSATSGKRVSESSLVVVPGQIHSSSKSLYRSLGTIYMAWSSSPGLGSTCATGAWKDPLPKSDTVVNWN